MYREFDIGTAKPTAAGASRSAHHLFDCVELDSVEPTGHITAGEYARQARQVLEDIRSKGTCRSLSAERDSICGRCSKDFLRAAAVGRAAQRLRERATSRGLNYLHRILGRLDRAAAEKIHAHDIPKVVRAIEVCLESRQKMTELWQQHGRDPLRGFRILRLGLDPDRQALYERINRRAQQMFEAGLVEETQRLRERFGEQRVAAVFPRL